MLKTIVRILWMITFVTYWPSTEPSIKRCTCVNKLKNSGSRWTLNYKLTRRTDGLNQLGQLETRCRSENQRQTEGFELSVTHGWTTPAKMRKKCCYRQKNYGQYVAVCPRLQLTSYRQPTSTLSRIKRERYIFIKKFVRSFIEVRHCVWLCLHVSCIFVLRYTTHLITNNQVNRWVWYKGRFSRSKAGLNSKFSISYKDCLTMLTLALLSINI